MLIKHFCAKVYCVFEMAYQTHIASAVAWLSPLCPLLCIRTAKAGETSAIANASEDTLLKRPRREKTCFKHVRLKKGSYDEVICSKNESFMDSLSF